MNIIYSLIVLYWYITDIIDVDEVSTKSTSIKVATNSIAYKDEETATVIDIDKYSTGNAYFNTQSTRTKMTKEDFVSHVKSPCKATGEATTSVKRMCTDYDNKRVSSNAGDFDCVVTSVKTPSKPVKDKTTFRSDSNKDTDCDDKYEYLTCGGLNGILSPVAKAPYKQDSGESNVRTNTKSTPDVKNVCNADGGFDSNVISTKIPATKTPDCDDKYDCLTYGIVDGIVSPAAKAPYKQISGEIRVCSNTMSSLDGKIKTPSKQKNVEGSIRSNKTSTSNDESECSTYGVVDCNVSAAKVSSKRVTDETIVGSNTMSVHDDKRECSTDGSVDYIVSECSTGVGVDCIASYFKEHVKKGSGECGIICSNKTSACDYRIECSIVEEVDWHVTDGSYGDITMVDNTSMSSKTITNLLSNLKSKRVGYKIVFLHTSRIDEQSKQRMYATMASGSGQSNKQKQQRSKPKRATDRRRQNHNKPRNNSSDVINTPNGNNSSDDDEKKKIHRTQDKCFDVFKTNSSEESSDESEEDTRHQHLSGEIICKKKPSSRKTMKLKDEIKSQW